MVAVLIMLYLPHFLANACRVVGATSFFLFRTLWELPRYILDYARV